MNIKHSGFWLVTVLILFLIYLAVVQFMLVLYEGYFSGHLYNWKSFHIVDEKTGWALEPGARGYVPTHNGLIETIINSSGLRDDEYPLEKNKDISRIMFLGDSFLYDNAFRHQETYHYMTEFRLKRWGYKSEIINASANGYGTGQEYLYYANKGKAFKPDICILHIYVGNDIRDNAAGIYSQLTGDPVPKPYFILNERKDGLILKNYPYKGELAGSFIDELNKPISIFGYKPFRLFSLKVLRLHENLIHQIWKYKISPIIRRKQENSLKQEKEILDRLFGPLFVENPSQYWVDALKITEMLILKLKNEVENDGAAFGVVIIPTREQMEKSEENDHGLYTVDERLLSFLDKNDVKHLYLYPEFKKVHKIHAELYEGGVHWNSAGHSVASFHVAKWLSSDFTIKKGKAEEWKWD